MFDNPQVHEFQHTGKRNGRGHITYLDTANNTITQLDMKRSNDGLWFVHNPILLPPTTPSTRPHTMIHPNPTTQQQTQRQINATHQPHSSPSITNPQRNSTLHDSTKPLPIKQLELWHQRMGHPSPTTLRHTTQVVEGIPNLPTATSHFHCPFCDISKITKLSGNKQATRETFLPGTAYHMDVGFIRGPQNLSELISREATTPGNTTIFSHDGYSAYLLIIDAATRYIFCFPLKSKSPPIDIIDKFLAKHGPAKRKLITTTTNGLLHKSTSFTDVCTKYGYDKSHHQLADNPTQDIQMLGIEQPRYYVRTDNGNELAGSAEFRQTVDKHGYIVETTAPDTSSQNGLPERPHRALKERIRCLLYTAGLGLEFWSDALLHAVWLYNRTYHKAIDMTPYQSWTGRIPCLDRLLTFGAKITARKAKNRPTAMDPNTF